MRLLYKGIAPGVYETGNGSVAGGWTFAVMDQSAFTIASEDWLHKYTGISAVTESANIKYIDSIFPNDYVEVWGEYSDITPAKWIVYTKCYTRRKKSIDWKLAATGSFTFVQINKNRNIVKIPKEVINEIKG